jgi:hypothetical protein
MHRSIPPAHRALWAAAFLVVVSLASLTLAQPPPGGRGPFGRGGFAPASQTVALLAWPSIQEELALSDEQRTKVQGFRDQRSNLDAGEEFTKGAEKAKEIDRAAEEMLKPEQKKRLQQLRVWQQLRAQPQDAVFTLPAVVAALKVTEDQRNKIAELRKERDQRLAAVYLSDEDADAIGKKAEAHRKETYALLKKLLDAGQQEALLEVVGKPFAGVGDRGGRGGGLAMGLPARNKGGSLVILGIPFAEDPALHKELKLSDDQAEQLVERARKHGEGIWEFQRSALLRGFGGRGAVDEEAIKKRDALLAETPKAVGEILTAAQLKRFKELILQQPRLRGWDPLDNREIIDGLKLTELQREKILDGEALDKVLSKEQQEKWTAMKGEPFKGVLVRKDSMPGRVILLLPTSGYLLAQASVQEDLQLSDEQRQKVKDDLPAKWQAVSNFSSRDDRTKKSAEAYKLLDKAIADILKPAQERRLREIEFQQQEKDGMRKLLATTGLGEKLSLTEEQKKKVAAINENADKVQQLMLLNNWPQTGPASGGLLYETRTKLAKATDDRVAAVLTADQKAKLKEMSGKPFTGELAPRRDFPFRGRGGFPGGGNPDNSGAGGAPGRGGIPPGRGGFPDRPIPGFGPPA